MNARTGAWMSAVSRGLVKVSMSSSALYPFKVDSDEIPFTFRGVVDQEDNVCVYKQYEHYSLQNYSKKERLEELEPRQRASTSP